jgi:hypothetical protein
VRITAVRCEGPTDSADGGATLIGGRPGGWVLDYAAAEDRPVGDLRVALTVWDPGGGKLFTCGTRFEHGPFRDAPPRGSLRCRLPRVVLAPGRYTYSLWCEADGRRADQIDDAGAFTVVPSGSSGTGQVPDAAKHGPILIEHAWELAGEKEPARGGLA